MPVKKSTFKLSIVIPAYNEESRLGPSLEKISAWLRQKRLKAEIIVVDDGSADGTPGLVKEFQKKFKNIRLLASESNLGKGAAVKRGVLSARGGLVLFSDADMSTPIEELELMLPYAEQGFDVVIGSRAMRNSRVMERQPLYRHLGGKLFNLAVRMLTVGGFSDTQCGFKLFTREAGCRLLALQTIPGFGFDVEFLYLAQKLGYRCAEVPVRWVNSPESKVSIKAAIMTFTDLLKIRKNDLKGLYRQ